ncbi:MHO_1580 family protein [Mycoplasma procyoni]|uniref:MHO_1580 family protein n=1 Tax=Mycoplasma procyoni TaxID=568784 RepID=UPI00197C269A|nr:hypothetical protein [Mycoplasma procyoni]MBN3535079.1 hypothetical protein [Mycoplasma procyoni]
MNNAPVVYKIKDNQETEIANIKEIIDISKRKLIPSTRDKEDKQYIEIKRNIKDDTFVIKVTYFSKTEKSVRTEIEINNTLIEQKVVQDIKVEGYKTFYFPFIQNTKIKFSDIQNMSIVSTNNTTNNPLLISQLTFNKNPNKQSDFFVENALNFQTMKMYRTASFVNDIEDHYQDGQTKIYFNNITFYKMPLVQGEHNEVLFKVVANNDKIAESELLDRDIAIVTKNVENLPLENKEKLNVSFYRHSHPKKYKGKTEIGEIRITDETYYDFETSTVKKGVNNNSKRGFLVPFNFSGQIFAKINLSINNDYKDISLSFKHNIEKRWLDKDEGVVKLLINQYEESEISESEFRLIENKQFKYVIDSNLSLEALKNLYFSNKREEDEDEKDSKKPR